MAAAVERSDIAAYDRSQVPVMTGGHGPPVTPRAMPA
jgi:hypothetical protein